MAELNNIIFSIFLIFFGYFLTKYFLFYLKNYQRKLFIDDQFNKPQAFHENPTFRIGGVITFFLLQLVFIYLYFFENILFVEYISFCAFFFFLGLLDDMKIDIKPKFRLLIMIVFLSILVIYNDLYIEKSGLAFLNHLLEIDIFALFFICLCFLFIVNGANLIDGFNGLLGLHSLVIFIVLFSINLINDNQSIAYVLFYTILLNLVFLKFNFPKGDIFLGDSGAYLFGITIAISTVMTSKFNPLISPFFFCVILSYLFFEVFFSFFRKIIVAGQSPLLPDNKHLHMFLYKFFLKKNTKKLKSNFKVTMYINSIYLLLILPVIFFMENGLFCRYYFFVLLAVYIYFYNMLNNAVK